MPCLHEPSRQSILIKKRENIFQCQERRLLLLQGFPFNFDVSSPPGFEDRVFSELHNYLALSVRSSQPLKRWCHQGEEVVACSITRTHQPRFHNHHRPLKMFIISSSRNINKQKSQRNEAAEGKKYISVGEITIGMISSADIYCLVFGFVR